jgi:subtilisin family serine protease
MPATNTRGTATPLDDVYATPSVPAGWTVKSLGYGFQQVTAPGVSLQNVSAWASANKARYVEPSVVRDKPASTFTTVRLPSAGTSLPLAAAPNDPSFNQQWALSNTGQNGGRVGADMSVLSAWDVTTGSSAAVVAVMDTGVDYRHPDLAPNMWTRPANIPASVVGVHGYDTGDDDADPLDDSAEAGHGTHVAGILGAKGNNGIGISGINQTVSIIAMKIADSDGALVGDLAAMVKLVELKQTYGVNIVAANASYGGPMARQAERDAISLLDSAGILLVAAAGNSSNNNDGGRHNYPSDYTFSNIVGVASTGNNDSLAYYSSYGTTSIDVAAPGGAMSSQTDPRGILSTLPNNTYGFYQGTSMAAPYVTGLAALLKAAKPSATATEIRKAILDGVDKVPALGRFVATGGRINARKSIDLLLGNSTPVATVSVANVSVAEGNAGTKSVQVTFTLSAAATSATTIAYRTAAGTATAGSDFYTAAGTLSIPAGSTTGTVSVTVLGDAVVEPDETFTVQVSSVNGTPVTNVSGTVTIVNDDTPASGPVVNVGDTSVQEGHFGTPVMRFTITLATPATRQTSVNYVTSNGTAIAGEDYFATKGTAVFKAGEISKTVDVRVVGDVRVESDETLTMTLSKPVGLTLGKATATGTIVNDDSNSPPTTPTPPGAGGFQIIVRFPDNSLTATQQQVFQTAAARWSQIISADLPDVTYQGRSIDDLEISATAPRIDGPGGILGGAAPTARRAGTSGLPYLGEMVFDFADVARLERDGSFASVILHEMGHVLGIGALWQQLGLVQGIGTTNPVYVGANAVREYAAIFGVSSTSVPVENTGGQGTAGAHWRDSVLQTELMTGYAERPGVAMPISRITVGSLQDLGYTVNYSAADAFAKPASSTTGAGRSIAVPLSGLMRPSLLLVAPRPAITSPQVAKPVVAGPRMASPVPGSPTTPTSADAPVVRIAPTGAWAESVLAVGRGPQSKRLRSVATDAGESVSPFGGRDSGFARLAADDRLAGSRRRS